MENHLKKPKPGRFQRTEDEHPVQRVLVNKFGGKASVNEPRVFFLFPAEANEKLSERVRKTKFPLTTWQTVIL